MYSTDGNRTFFWQTEDDPDYEGLIWEPSSKIIYHLPNPEPTERPQRARTDVNGTSAARFTFDQLTLDAAAKSFREWKK